MTRNERGLIILHGAALVLLGLLCGLAAVASSVGVVVSVKVQPNKRLKQMRLRAGRPQRECDP